MKCILLRQCAHVFNGHCVTNIAQCDSINRNRKKKKNLNEIYYKNHEI